MTSKDLQPTLFESPTHQEAPLAQKMRPITFEEIVGQTHFVNERLRKILQTDRWSGFLLWGPPGTGKTTLATVIAKISLRPFHTLSAVTSGVKEIREVLETSKKDLLAGRKAHILFIDEVHRLNKGQQDVLLPFLEDGSIRFIGATTENPSFEINNAISSRCIIYSFRALNPLEIIQILEKAAKNRKKISPEVLERIAQCSLGDARRALTLLDHLYLAAEGSQEITVKDFDELSHSQSLYYDKKSEQHYDTISAFIKSVRGSDANAAVYYLARMLEAGEDPLFIARRLIILASEDIGNAAPLGLVLATAAHTAVHAIGMPEARIILSQVTTYLASCEKSNRSYVAINKAIEAVKEVGNAEIPLAIRNAPTKMMKEWGYGKDYKYAHDYEDAKVDMQFLPNLLKDRVFYEPSNRGHEKRK